MKSMGRLCYASTARELGIPKVNVVGKDFCRQMQYPSTTIHNYLRKSKRKPM